MAYCGGGIFLLVCILMRLEDAEIRVRVVRPVPAVMPYFCLALKDLDERVGICSQQG